MTFRVLTAITAALFCTLLGAWSLVKNPRGLANRTFAFFNLTLVAWNLNETIVYVADHSLALILYRISYIGGSFVAFSFLMFMYAVVEDNRDSLIYRFIKWAAFAFASLSATDLLVQNIQYSYKQSIPVTEVPGPLYIYFTVYFLASLIYSLYPLFRNYRNSSGFKRNQLRYVMLAVLIGIVALGNYFAYQLSKEVPPFFYVIQMGISTTFSVAILKHRLMDITVIIRKTLTYSMVMGTLTAIYLGIIALFAKLFEGLTGYQTIFSSAVAACLITIGFQPLRKKVQTFVDRKFFRQYVDREEKLYELSRDVITHTTPGAMGDALKQVLTETFHPKGGALFVRAREGSGFVPVTAWGETGGGEHVSEDNALALYFADHPQPFIQDVPSGAGAPHDTRQIMSPRQQTL